MEYDAIETKICKLAETKYNQQHKYKLFVIIDLERLHHKAAYVWIIYNFQ